MPLYSRDAITALMSLSNAQIERALRMNHQPMPEKCFAILGATFLGMDDHGAFHYDVIFKRSDGEATHKEVSIKYFRLEANPLIVPLAF